MEPLKRKILFDKKRGFDKSLFTEEELASQISPTVEPTKTNKILHLVDEHSMFQTVPEKPRSEKIIEWFGSHELISVKGVCDMAGIDTSNFNKLLKAAKVIPDKLLDKIEPIIKQYGYQ